MDIYAKELYAEHGQRHGHVSDRPATQKRCSPTGKLNGGLEIDDVDPWVVVTKQRVQELAKCLEGAQCHIDALTTKFPPTFDKKAHTMQARDTTDALNCADYNRIRELEMENYSLRIQLDETRRQLQQHRFHDGLSEEQQAEIDRQLSTHRQKAEKLELEKSQLQELVNQLEQKIEILSAQLITYKDDFDLERKDREIAQGKVASLEQQLRKMNVTPCYDFNAYKQPSSTGANFYQHHQGWSHENRTHTPERHLNLRHGFDECDHIQVDNPDLCDGPSSLSLTLKSFEAHEIPQSSSKSGIDAGTSSWKSKEKLSVSPPIQLVSRGPIASPKDNRKPTSAVLKCPGCFKTFTQEDHILLLEHLEVCTL